MKALCILFLCISLESCWVLQTQNGQWTGTLKQFSAYDKDTLSNQELYASIEFGHGEDFIPLPLILVATNRSKDYGVLFHFQAFNAHYKKIDSVAFRIYNPNNSMIYSGSVAGSSKSNLLSDKGARWGTKVITLASVESRYNLKLSVMDTVDLHGDFTAYLTTDNNQHLQFIFNSRQLIPRIPYKRFCFFM